MIKVNGRVIPYHSGFTLAEAICEAGEESDGNNLVMVNGRVASREELSSWLADEKVDWEVIVMRIVSGG